MAQPAAPPEQTDVVIAIDDTSPTVVYTPRADASSGPNLLAGWNSYYSETGFTPNPVSGQGVGTSLHVTSADGASFALRWNGTAVSLYGFFPTSAQAFPTAVSYSVALDGTATTNYASGLSPDADPAKSVLAAFADLTNGEHVVQLTVHNPNDLNDPSILLQFDRAVITSSLPAQAMKQSSNITLVTRTLADDALSFHGQWSFNSHLLSGQNASFHTSNNLGDRASLSFNGTSVTLAGLTTPLSGAYNISLDGSPPELFSARSPFNLSAPTLLFVRTGLDPSVPHTLDIVNAGPESADTSGSLLVIGSVNVTTVEDGNGSQPVAAMSSSGHLSAGTIAALVVGIIFAAFALIVMLVCYARRRKRDRQRKQSFLVNPRISSRRLSFLRPRRSHASDPEKGPKGSPRPPVQEILDISRKTDDDDYEDFIQEVEDSPVEDIRGARHASKNSDGSFSINLPELPGQTYVRVRTSGDSPSPTRRTTIPPPTQLDSAELAAVRTSVAGHTASPSSPRSPKPRGPREMRSSTLGPSREGPQSILLKRVQTLPADASLIIPRDGLAAGPSALAPPGGSPLRVNFEEGSEDRESRPQRRSTTRSVASAISLPSTLRNALHSWGLRSPEPSSENVTNEGEVRMFPRYSFLDMDSSASQSSGSRSARQSQTASTRASSRTRYPNTPTESSSAQESSSNSHGNRENRMSLALSMTLAGGPTSSHPSASPAVSLQAVPLPPISVPAPLLGAADVPQSVHPADLAELLPSPTDSIPLTVSDIHFRYSTQSSVSVPESRIEQSRVRQQHPPMPAPPPEPRPYIVQRLTGARDAGPDPSTPYSVSRMSAPASTPSSTIRGRPRATASGPSFSSLMPSRSSTRDA